ncbi:MAG: hypothetical protein Q8Q76_09230, partial [Methylotenera sp.]|nr:hypothetical protein [Methylotenera sp.]
MQTSLLKAPQPAQKNITELVNKNEQNINKSASSVTKTPFQMELARQAKKQSSQPNQSPPVTTQNKAAQNAHAARSSATNKPAGASKVSAEEAVDQLANTAQGTSADLSLNDRLAEIELSLSASVVKDASVDELALDSEDLTTHGVAIPSFATIAHVTALINPKNTSTSTKNDANLQLSLGTDASAKIHNNLDAMLGNALSQVKGAEEKVAIDSSVDKALEQQSRGDGKFENVAAKAVLEDLSANKSMLNAVSALANKDIS